MASTAADAYLETLYMDATERQELVAAIATAIVSAPKPPPSPAESAQRVVGLVVNLVGLIGVLVAASGWAFSLQGQLQAVAANVAETKMATAALAEKTDRMLTDRWTRTDHDAFVQAEIRPLEARIRAIETRAAR